MRPPPIDPESIGDRVALAPGVSIPSSTLRFTAVRSSGPGGQNVNKVSSKIELRLDLADLPLDAAPMSRLRRLAGRRITSGGELVITADGDRSQHANRAAALERLQDLVTRALIAPKPRYATKPTKGSERRRIEAKKRRSQSKQSRQRPPERD